MRFYSAIVPMLFFVGLRTCWWRNVLGLAAGLLVFTMFSVPLYAQSATIQGLLIDEHGVPLPGARIRLIPQTSGQGGAQPTRRYTARTDTAGRFTLVVPQGKTYTVKVFALNQWLETNKPLQIDRWNGPVTIEFTIQLFVDTIYKRTIPLEGVKFAFNEARILPESYPILDRWVQYLKEHPTMVVEIAGHTDSVGSEQYNLYLSRRRAEAVRNYFIQKGIDPERLIARGYGEYQPIADNGTPEGRARNRRVEIRVIRE